MDKRILIKSILEILSPLLAGIYIFFVLIIPSLGRAFGASSMAGGSFLVAILCIAVTISHYSICISYRPKNISPLFFYLTLILFILTLLQGMFIFLNDNSFDYNRFIFSSFLLVLYVLGAYSFYEIIIRIRESILFSSIKIVYFLFLLSSIFGFFRYSPFFGGAYDKPVLFYSEPSLFSLDFIPIVLSIVVVSPLRNKYLLITIGVVIAFLLKNLTLLVGMSIVSVISLRFGRSSLLILIFLVTIILSASSSFFGYYSSRLNISDNSKNLSVLAYMQGWERSYLDFVDTSGTGVGFQQFGIVGRSGSIQRILAHLGAKNLNMKDGASVGSKFIGEFGLLGIFMLAIYVLFFIKISRMIHDYSVSGIRSYGFHDVLFMSVFVVYFVDIFIRGSGYFTSSGFIFLSSLFYLFNRAYPGRRLVYCESSCNS